MNDTYYEEIATALVEDGYIVLQQGLDPQLLEALGTFALTQSGYKKAAISASSDAHIDSSKRRDKTQWIDADGGVQSQYLAFMEGLRCYLNRTLYLGLSYYESHFALYEEGDFYEKHLDAFVGEKNRVVTTVLYLNRNYKKEDGGALVIYDMDGEIIQEVAPENGTLVLFLSDRFPHEVLSAKSKRHSIAGWFRVDR